MQNQVCEDRLLLLPPRLAIVPHVAVDALAVVERALDDVVPAAALRSLPALGISSAILRARSTYFVLRARVLNPHQVPRDLQVVAHDCAILLPAPRVVVRPVFENRSWTNGLCS